VGHCQCTNVHCVSGSTVVCHTAMYVLFHENKQIEMEIEIIFWPSVLRSRGSLNWLSNTKWYDRQSVQSAHYYYYIIIKRKNRAMYILVLPLLRACVRWMEWKLGFVLATRVSSVAICCCCCCYWRETFCHIVVATTTATTTTTTTTTTADDYYDKSRHGQSGRPLTTEGPRTSSSSSSLYSPKEHSVTNSELDSRGQDNMAAKKLHW